MFAKSLKRFKRLHGKLQAVGQFIIGAWGSSGSDVFAVGDSGAIVHYGFH